jgi:hypothetical protein
MRMAGHSDFKTTERYIDLAGVLSGDDVRLLGDWYASTGTKNRYQVGAGADAARMAAAIEPLAD